VQQGTRDLNQRTSQHLQKGKKVVLAKKRKKIKKVIGALKKASKAHAGQAKVLQGIMRKNNGKKSR
tara:strand:+ start:54 stop:251 length:198 start_codon:yes stop_codon:yes gene_type:complete